MCEPVWFFRSQWHERGRSIPLANHRARGPVRPGLQDGKNEVNVTCHRREAFEQGRAELPRVGRANQMSPSRVRPTWNQLIQFMNGASEGECWLAYLCTWRSFNIDCEQSQQGAVCLLASGGRCSPGTHLAPREISTWTRLLSTGCLCGRELLVLTVECSISMRLAC